MTIGQQTASMRQRRQNEGVLGRLRRAGYRLRSPWTMLQALLAATCVALIALWLEIPDANVPEMILSFAVALGGLVGFAWAQSYLLGLVRRRQGVAVAVWKGGLLLLGMGLLYWLVVTFFDAGQIQDGTRAESWARQGWLHARASEEALVRLEGAGWWLLRWLVIGCLVPFAMEGAATEMGEGWAGRAGSVLKQPMYWMVLLLGAAIATAVTAGLLHARPELPAILEILLTVGKVVVIAAVDLGVACFVLSLTGTFLRDVERVRLEARGGLPSSGRFQTR